MPLQWLPLDLSRYDKQQQVSRMPRQGSAISEALRPQERGAVGGGMSAPRSLVETAKERGSRQAKANKEEEQRWRDYYEEMGRKAAAKHESGQERAKQITASREAEKKARKEAVPGMAMEAYKFAMTLDEEGQKSILDAVRRKPEIANYLRDVGVIDPKGKFVQLAKEPMEHNWSLQEGFLVDKTTGTFYEMPEKEADKLDLSQIFELKDTDGNVYFMYKDKVLQPSAKAPEVKEPGEKMEKVINAATKIADGVGMKGTPQWEEAFKSAVTAVGEAYELTPEEVESASKLTGVKSGQARDLAMQFKDAGYTSEMMTQEIKDQILSSNPTLNAQTLNAAIDMLK